MWCDITNVNLRRIAVGLGAVMRLQNVERQKDHTVNDQKPVLDLFKLTR